MTSAAATAPPASERMRRAWAAHPLVTFSRHRRDVAFYRQLHALLKAGEALPTAFAQLARYAPDARLSEGLRAVSRSVAGGSTMADAFRQHASVFDDVNVELIAFAEEAGTLETVLARLIEHMEHVHRLRWRTVFMSLWPLYLGVAFVFVGPLLGVARQAAPGVGLGGLYVAGVMRNLLLAGAVVTGVVGFPLLIAALNLDVQWDTVKRQVPGVSAAMRDLSASRFVLGLGLALGAGLEVVRALRVGAKATHSPSILARLPAAEAVLRRGGTLTEAVDALEVLDRSTGGTLAVAERTGTLSDTLHELSVTLQESALRATRVLMLVVIALVAAVLLGSIVAGVMGTILGPVKRLYDAAGSGNLDGL